MKEYKNKTKKFKSVDAVSVRGNIINLIEFKRSDLFYREELDTKEGNMVESMTNDLPDKLKDSILVHLPHICSDYKNLINYKINYYVVLGTLQGDAKGMGRERAVLKLERPQYEKMKDAVYKYSQTPYINTVKIMAKEEFDKLSFKF